MVGNFRKFINPPYTEKNLLIIFGALFVLVTIPVTIYFSIESEKAPNSTQVQAATNSLDLIISDSTGSHPACVQDTAGYAWRDGPFVYTRGAPPSGATRISGWVMMNWQASCTTNQELSPSAAVPDILITNFRLFVLKSSGEWQQVASQADLYGWQENDPNYDLTFNNVYDDCPPGSEVYPCPPPYQVPHNRGKQAFTTQRSLPSGVIGMWATYDVRISGGSALIMSNCGSDYYSSSAGYLGGIVTGKFRALTTSDQPVNCTNLTETQLRANPPPGLGGGDQFPTVSITSPTNGATITTNPYTITATASDNIGVSKVEFFVDGASKCIDTSSPYSCSWTTSGLTGSHTIYARATDTINQTSQTPTFTVTVSLGGTPPPPPPPPPTGTVSLTLRGDPATGPYSVIASTTISGDVKVVFLVDGSIFRTENDAPYELFGDGVNSSLGAGSHTVAARVYAQTDTSNSSLLGSNQITISESQKTGDQDGDGDVDIFDLSALVTRWGTSDANADLNSNGKVDIYDLSILLSNWGA